jgi:hypothetical protein
MAISTTECKPYRAAEWNSPHLREGNTTSAARIGAVADAQLDEGPLKHQRIERRYDSIGWDESDPRSTYDP